MNVVAFIAALVFAGWLLASALMAWVDDAPARPLYFYPDPDGDYLYDSYSPIP